MTLLGAADIVARHHPGVFRPERARRKRAVPNQVSRAFTSWLTALCVSESSRAAAEKLPCRAAASKARRG